MSCLYEKAETEAAADAVTAPPRVTPSKDLPASALAYLGDAVYELLVRERLLTEFNRPAGALHKLSIQLVNAGFQARAARFLQADFSAEEEAVFKRGRNADPGAMPRHADPVDYRLATGLETLVGFLYREGRTDRLAFLFDRLFQYVGEHNLLAK